MKKCLSKQRKWHFRESKKFEQRFNLILLLFNLIKTSGPPITGKNSENTFMCLSMGKGKFPLQKPLMEKWNSSHSWVFRMITLMGN